MMKRGQVAWLMVVPITAMLISLAPGAVADDKVHNATGKIHCYQCASDTKITCNGKTPSDPPTHQVNCSNPNKAAKDWLHSHGLEEVGVGKLNLQNFMDNVGDEIDSQAELKETSGCIFFYATSENSVTKGIDKGISYARYLVGDPGASDPVVVVEYTYRDCVTLRIPEGTAAAHANKCTTIPGTKDIMTVMLCICTADRCNEGINNPYLKGLINAAESSSRSVGKQYDKNLISTSVIITILSTFSIYSHC